MANLFINVGARLIVSADANQDEILFLKAIEYPITEVTDLLITSGSFEFGTAESDLSISMGDISTGHFLWVEYSVDGLSFKLSGTGNTAITLSRRISGRNSFGFLMGSFTSLHVSTTAAGRFTYAIAGAD